LPYHNLIIGSLVSVDYIYICLGLLEWLEADVNYSIASACLVVASTLSAGHNSTAPTCQPVW